MNNFLYLVPSMFTSVNIFCGFYSIIMSLNGNFESASWLIILAIVADGLDGTFARLTKTQDFFGAEFDSLADLVSFCLAPMILLYRLILSSYGSSGMLVAFVYVLFGAIRLAKYNVSVIKEKRNIFFEGLPTPAAAGVMVSVGLLLSTIGKEYFGKKNVFLITVPFILKFLPVIVLTTAFLMITKLRYVSFSRLRLSGKITLRLFTIIIGILLLVFSYPENTIFLLFSIYVLSGLIDYLARIYKMRFSKK